MPQPVGSKLTTWHQVCIGTLAVWWVLSGIGPTDRVVWAMESALVVLAIPLMIWIQRRVGLTNLAWTMFTLFTLVHIIGSHYTYSEVPLGDWARDAFQYERNHYDRLVHFLFGVMIAVPIRELLVRGARIPGAAVSSWLTLAIVMAASTSYELLEWWSLLTADPDAGIAYLGAQGDEWDAQKDTALASLGALLSMAGVYLAEKRVRRRSPLAPWIEGVDRRRGSNV
jgi:putative membrane protein